MALGAHASRRKADVKNKENPFPYHYMGYFILLAFVFLYSAIDLFNHRGWYMTLINLAVIAAAALLMVLDYKKVMEWAHRQDEIEQRRKDNPLDKMDRWN